MNGANTRPGFLFTITWRCSSSYEWIWIYNNHSYRLTAQLVEFVKIPWLYHGYSHERQPNCIPNYLEDHHWYLT